MVGARVLGRYAVQRAIPRSKIFTKDASAINLAE